LAKRGISEGWDGGSTTNANYRPITPLKVCKLGQVTIIDRMNVKTGV